MIKNAIILVPFPFDDFSASKVRPALCLTAEIGNMNILLLLSFQVRYQMI